MWDWVSDKLWSKGKKKYFSCPGCIAKEVRGIKCGKKEIKVRQQESLFKDEGSADWGQAAELPR